MEIYNPYSIVQVSEVLSELTVRSGERSIYTGKAVVVSLVNTGLMAVVSVSLTDEWSEFNAINGDLSRVSQEASRFVEEWGSRFRISGSYQVMISEFRAFLSEASKWADQADMSNVLPRDQENRIREDVFYDLAEPTHAQRGRVPELARGRGQENPSGGVGGPPQLCPDSAASTAAARPLCLPDIRQTTGVCGRLRNGEPDPGGPAAGQQHLLSDRQRFLPACSSGASPSQQDRHPVRLSGQCGRAGRQGATADAGPQCGLRAGNRSSPIHRKTFQAGPALLHIAGFQRTDHSLHPGPHR